MSMRRDTEFLAGASLAVRRTPISKDMSHLGLLTHSGALPPPGIAEPA